MTAVLYMFDTIDRMFVIADLLLFNTLYTPLPS